MTINLEEAEIAVTHAGKNPPEGWTVLSGCHRFVLKSPTGHVYKIDKPWVSKSRGKMGNKSEYAHYLKWKDYTYENWELVPIEQVKVKNRIVNVSPFIEGHHAEIFDEDYVAKDIDLSYKMDDAFDAFGLIDAHEENFVITPEGKYVIIDCEATRF